MNQQSIDLIANMDEESTLALIKKLIAFMLRAVLRENGTVQGYPVPTES